jgi:large subunit ribosomal protein L15
MSLAMHTIKPAAGSRHRKKILGRGNASGHGTYSTKGQKGQRARSGGRKGLKIKGFKRMILSFPKLRGFKSSHPKPAILNLKDLKKIRDAKITPEVVLKSGLVYNIKDGVKILGDGEIKRAIIVEGCAVSKSAKEKIEKAGGTVK